MARAVTPDLPDWVEISQVAAEHGIDHLGVAPATVLQRARSALYERKADGLSADMQFTYRNPDRSTDPTRSVSGAQSIIVGALAYPGGDDPSPPDHGDGTHRRAARIARYARADYYGRLRVGLGEIARRIRSAGERAVVFADDNSIVDREVAYLAGIGWFGKNANLLVPGAGSFFVLGSVITTAAYATNAPIGDGCGGCRRCLDGCPTGAIVAPGVIDANRCLAWLVQRGGTFPVEFRSALGDRFYGCDACQEVCPPTVRHRGGRCDDVNESDSESAWIDVAFVLTADDATLLDRFAAFYVAERDPRWWRRTALVVAGNIVEGDDVATIDIVASYVVGDDPILAEHAEWALAQIQQRQDRRVEVGSR